MTRKIFNDGMVLPAEDVNSIAYPVPDGLNLIGHGDKIIDEWLNDEPDQIKARFYSWYNRFKVEVVSGLNVSVQAGIINNQGTLISIPQQTLILQNNANSYIYIGTSLDSNTIAVRVSASPVEFEHIPLAYVTTASSVVTVLNDLRFENAVNLPVRKEQLVNTGDVIFSMSVGAVPAGFLELNGSNVSRTTYNKLWLALGSPNTGNGSTTFTLPDVSDLMLRMGNASNAGVIGGNDSFTIGVNNLPAHNHLIDDLPHNHGITQTPHNHGTTQTAHNHTVIDGQHGHILPGFVYDTDASEGSDGSGSAYAPLGSTTYLASSNISLQSSTVNITVNNANAGISVNNSTTGINQTRSTGSNTPITFTPRFITMRAFIKF
jgi:microcystin-dependent protein